MSATEGEFWPSGRWDAAGDEMHDGHVHHTWMIDLTKKQITGWEDALKQERQRRLPPEQFGFR